MISGKHLPVFLLVLAIFGGGGLRLAGILGKRQVEMDEGISYLAATGHQGEYETLVQKESPPYGEWVRGEQWRRLIRIEDPLPFNRIRDDLARTDVHPPLYFWLLHLWFLLLGTSLASGPLLNLLLFLPSVLLLYRLARRCLEDPGAAGLVALAWAWSPAVIATTWIARSYGLLVFCLLLLVEEVEELISGQDAIGKKNYLLLALAVAAGVLTHYSFLIPVSGCLALAGYRLGRTNPTRFWLILAALALGIAVALTVQPAFLTSFFTQQVQAKYSPYGGFLFRVGRVISATLEFLVGNRALQGLVAATLAIWGLGHFLRRNKSAPSPGLAAHNSAFTPLFFLFWIGGAIAFFYLAGFNPLQQMGSRYLTLVYPFLAFLPALFFRRRRRTRQAITISFFTLLALSAATRTARFRSSENKALDPADWLLPGETVLIDNVFRTFLPRLIYHLPDDQPVFAANQDFLTRDPASWQSRLAAGSLYISRGHRGEKIVQEKLLELIEEGREMEPVSGNYLGNGKIFRIRGKK